MTNLQVFLDPEYEGFEGFPGHDLDPSSATYESDMRDEALALWLEAISPEITALLVPSALAGLIPGSSTADFASSFTGSGSDHAFGTSDTEHVLATALDDAMEAFADAVSDVKGTTFSTPMDIGELDSENLIFDPNLEYTPEEICARAEDRIISWLQTGTFTSFYYDNTWVPGIDGTPWGAEGDPPPDRDNDGVPDDADADPDDADNTDVIED